jgi:hypothetical protein
MIYVIWFMCVHNDSCKRWYIGAWHMQQFSQTQGIVIRWLIIKLKLHFIYWSHHVWNQIHKLFYHIMSDSIVELTIWCKRTFTLEVE